MDLKERLRQLSSISKVPVAPIEEEEGRGDLRERLDSLLRTGKVYPKREHFPIEKLIHGEIISTPGGETFRAEEYFPPHFRYGEMTLAELHNIPTYPAHLL